MEIALHLTYLVAITAFFWYEHAGLFLRWIILLLLAPNITALKQLENTDQNKNVYPNPFTQTLQIEKETDEETEVKLYGPDGKILFEGYTGKNKTTVNTSGFAWCLFNYFTQQQRNNV